MRKIEINPHLILYRKKYSEKIIGQIRNLWLNSFQEDDSKYFDFFHKNYFKNLKKFLYFDKNDQLVFMFFYSTYFINNVKTFFIQGVATKKDYMKKGIMKRTLSQFIDSNTKFNIFFQAYNWDIYNSLNIENVSTYNLLKPIFSNYVSLIECKNIIIKSDYRTTKKHLESIKKVYKHIGARTYFLNTKYMTVMNNEVIDNNFINFQDLANAAYSINPNILVRDYTKKIVSNKFEIIEKNKIDTARFVNKEIDINNNLQCIYII